MAKVFISYRRDDSKWPALLIHERLKVIFGGNVLFFDVATLDPGDEFEERIMETLNQIDVLIAIIGTEWLTITQDSKKRRLDNPDDILRREIAIALKRNIRVIPVLVDGATMPKEEELPDDLKPLAKRNECRINHMSFDYDMGKLVNSIGKTLGVKATSNSDTSIPTEGRLNTNYPGNIFWLAHNIEHTRLRLELQWPKNEVISMLDNCIHHATQAHVPSEYISWLRQIRENIDQTSNDQTRWHESAQDLDGFSRRIAHIAQKSHPPENPFVLPSGVS
jgi:hypothetical protein